VQLGALVTQLEFLMEQKTHLLPEQSALIGKINEVISYMDELTKRYQNMYRYDCEVERVDVQKMINKIKLLLKHSIEKSGTKIVLNMEQENPSLTSNANTLMHVLIILIDNAISISEKRKVKHPVITDYQKSEKEGGLGYGLYLARHLYQEVLKANISVKNSEQGANFLIIFD